MIRLTAIVLLCLSVSHPLVAAPKWLDLYKEGLDLMEEKRYQDAALKFLRALEEKDRDNEKERLSGMRTVEYFPHRELGICLYHLGISDFAKEELRISLNQSWSRRAENYLGGLGN